MSASPARSPRPAAPPLPPAPARALLARLLPPAERAELLAFLDEIWLLRVRSDGPNRAALWYWGQVVVAPLRLAAERLRHGLPSPSERIPTMFDELRLAVRRLVQAPGFAAATVLTLGLGIGTNTAVYSLVKGVLLDPLPYPESERLVSVWHTAPGAGVDEFEQSEATMVFYQERARSLQSFGGWDHWSGTLTGVETPEHLRAARFTETLLPTLGVQPLMGRAFTADDALAEAPAVAILSHATWQRRYGGDPAALGQRMILDGVATEIVGVMPRSFAFPDSGVAYWTPLPYDRDNPTVSSFFIKGLGRLAPGTTLASLNDELAGLVPRLPEVYSDGLINSASIEQIGMGAYARAYRRDVVGRVDRVLWILVGAASFVLLVSAANVTNLFLVRAEAREREIAVRGALGAGRSGLARLFVADSLLVSGLGGAVGLAVASAVLGALRSTASIEIPRIGDVDVDAGVLAFHGSLAAVAAVLFSVYPLLRYRGGRALAGLHEGSRGDTGSRRRVAIRNALVASQIALALVLLVGSMLLMRSVWHLATVDPGFRPDHVLTAHLMLVDEERYPSRRDRDRFHQSLMERLAALPQVASAASVDSLPMVNFGNRSSLWFEDFPRAEGEIPDIVYQRFASPGYFETLSIPLLRGRAFEAADHGDRRPVMLVSESLATRLWPGGDPLGKRARRGLADDDPWLTIVGVVGDVRNGGLTEERVEMAYYPIDGPDGTDTWYPATMSLVVRTSGDPPEALAPLMRSIVHALDPDLPLTDVTSLERVVAASIAPISFTMAALLVATGMALTLGVIGIYGVVSYVVAHRTREICVRMALGARRRSVVRMVLSQGLRMALAGAAIGLVGAATLTRFLDALLFDVSPLDPTAFLGTAVTLIAVAMLATYLPARRAASIEPATALRSE